MVEIETVLDGVTTSYGSLRTSTTYGGAPVLSREALLEFDTRADFACFVCRRAGLSCGIGERQTWQVGEQELTVELQLDKRVFYVLYLRAGWPSSPDIRTRRSLCLAEVYAITLTGTIRDLRGPELARFKVKALADAGLLDLPTVHLPDLPNRAPASAIETWDLIRELAAARAATGDIGPMPLVAPWLASWNGTSESAIKAGKQWLEHACLIVHVDHAPGRFGKTTKLWQITGLEDAIEAELDPGILARQIERDDMLELWRGLPPGEAEEG